MSLASERISNPFVRRLIIEMPAPEEVLASLIAKIERELAVAN